KPAAEAATVDSPPPLSISSSVMRFSISYRLLFTMSTILYKNMCQVFLDHSIVPHFPALYFYTLSYLPLGSLQIFDTFRYRRTFQYILKSLGSGVMWSVSIGSIILVINECRPARQSHQFYKTRNQRMRNR